MLHNSTFRAEKNSAGKTYAQGRHLDGAGCATDPLVKIFNNWPATKAAVARCFDKHFFFCSKIAPKYLE